jgi:chromosome segregation ATPase
MTLAPMAKFHSALLAFFTMLLIVTGCAKTVEGESKKWEANTAEVNALGAKYPGMKPALDARLTSAKATWDSATGLSDEKAKIDAMAAANTALMAGFVTKLKNVEPSLAKLRESRVSAASLAGDESSRLAAKLAAEDAQKTIDRVEKTLKDGAKDEASATAILDKVTTDIETAQKAVDKVLEGDKKKADQKNADKAAADAAAAKADADKAAAVADWTCEYCDGKNKHDATTCSGCGAARPSK